MNLPIELKKTLGDVEPDAYAQLNATFGSPIGETHLVVINGGLKVFTRESLIGELEPVELDPAHPPKLESGSFSDTLHVALKDGESYEFNVGSFERDNVKSVLDAIGGEDAPTAPEQPEASHADRFKEAEDYQHDHGVSGAESTQRAAAESAQEGDYAHRRISYDTGGEQAYAVGKSEDYAAEKNQGYAAEQSRGYDAEESREYDSDGEESKGEKIGEGEIFRSNNPGTVGCILQTVLFFGGVVGFWFLHVMAMENAAEYFGWGELDPEGGAWVGTKIVALVCGAYAGGKASSLVGKLAKSQLWGGAVLFKGDLMVVFGPKSKWNQRVDLNQNLKWTCEWFSGSSSQSKDDKRSYHVMVKIEQEGVIVGFRTSFMAQQVNLHVKHMEYEESTSIPGIDNSISFDDKTFRQVIRKIAESKGWKA